MSAVVLFDGVCNLCNAAVNFIIDRDSNGYFRFAALQSEAGRRALAEAGGAVPAGDPETIVLIEDGKVYERSRAALGIARRLSGAWKLMSVFLVVPGFVRDVVYRFVARNRYQWFGRKQECRVPTEELRGRFLAD